VSILEGVTEKATFDRFDVSADPVVESMRFAEP
jgi:hypothetical protein